MIDAIKQNMFDTIKQMDQAVASTATLEEQSQKQDPDPSPTRPPATEVSLTQGASLLKNLPPLTMDPAVYLKNADQALKKVMAEMGIPPGTPMNIQVNNSGVISVNSNHEMAAELETALNTAEPGSAQFDVRNNLIAASTSTAIQRMVNVVSMAQRAAERDPGNADTFYAWAKVMIEDTKAMSYRASFGQGDDHAGTLLTAQEQAVGVREGLTLPT